MSKDTGHWLLCFLKNQSALPDSEELSPSPLASHVYSQWTRSLAWALNLVSFQLCLDPCGITICLECSPYFSLELHIQNLITSRVFEGGRDRCDVYLWSQIQTILIKYTYEVK